MMQLRETDELIEAMREQARADCLAMTRKWGSHQPSYAQEESENGKKNLIRRMIKVKLLYMRGKKTVEIAEEIKSDRSTVSKLLKMGKQRKYVRLSCITTGKATRRARYSWQRKYHAQRTAITRCCCGQRERWEKLTRCAIPSPRCA